MKNKNKDNLDHVIEYKLDYSEMEILNALESQKILKLPVSLKPGDESKNHTEFEKFINRKVRIIIETID